MPDPQRKPPASGVGEVRSLPPPAPSTPARPAGRFRAGAVRWAVPPSLLGVILGGIALGLIMLHLLCHAVRFSASPRGAADQVREEVPLSQEKNMWLSAADLADRVEAFEDAYGTGSERFAGLYGLALMETQDRPPLGTSQYRAFHEMNIWLLGADLAKRGYSLDGRDARCPNTIEELSPATIGLRGLRSPDSDPYKIEWTLDRRGSEGEKEVRSCLLIEQPNGHFCIEMGNGLHSYEMVDRLSFEWDRVITRLPNEVWRAGSDMIHEAERIYDADNRGGTWDGAEGKPFKVVHRGPRDPAVDSAEQYHMALHQEVGEYRLELDLRDNRADQPGWCRVLLCFIYLPEK